MEEKLLKIIKANEEELYPNGVGSVFRCVPSSNYNTLVLNIISLLKSEDLKV